MLPTNQTIIPAASYWQMATQLLKKSEKQHIKQVHFALFYFKSARPGSDGAQRRHFWAKSNDGERQAL